MEKGYEENDGLAAVRRGSATGVVAYLSNKSGRAWGLRQLASSMAWYRSLTPVTRAYLTT